MDALFTAKDAWSGGFFELCIELASSDESVIRQALTALWAQPQLTGYYLHNDREPREQERLTDWTSIPEGHVYGIARLPQGSFVPCIGSILDFESKDGIWLNLCVPSGSVVAHYKDIGGFPFNKESPAKEHALREIYGWLHSIAEGIYQTVHFTVAVIGFEVDLPPQLRQGIPPNRYDGLLLAQDGVLNWYPPTEYG